MRETYRALELPEPPPTVLVARVVELSCLVDFAIFSLVQMSSAIFFCILWIYAKNVHDRGFLFFFESSLYSKLHPNRVIAVMAPNAF